VKSSALVPVPNGVTMVIGPLAAPTGTAVVIWVAESTVKLVAGVSRKSTSVAPVNSVPVIVTGVPSVPLVGSNDVIVGAPVTVKSVALVPVPFGFVAVIGPVVASAGTTAVIRVAEFTVKSATTALNSTDVVPLKLVPVMTTDEPTLPLVGKKDVIVGDPAVVTVKLEALAAVPSGVVTLITPVVAPVGTTAVTCVAESTVKLVAAVRLNVTPVAPVRFVPVMITVVPTGPLIGTNEVIVGAVEGTVKFEALAAVPPGVVTLIGPVVAPVGTTAVICVAELTAKVVAAVALNVTSVAPVRFVPVITTDVPTGPLVGRNDVIVGPGGAGVTSKLEALVTAPSGVVTRILPSTAPVGTAAVICVPSGDQVKLVWSTPPNSTRVAPTNFEPVITTFVPTGPLVGEKDETVGAQSALTVK
jgi:hypothetical protein